MNEVPPPPFGEREAKEPDRRRLETVVPELIKRALEAGLGRLGDGPDNVKQFLAELKLPKEALAAILTHLDETKQGLYRAVSRELRDFLERTSFADEVAKALTTLSLEVTTKVRFVPNDTGKAKPPRPGVETRVAVRREADEAKPDSNRDAGAPEGSKAPDGDPETT